MSIFRKASDIDKMPDSVSSAFFDDHSVKIKDEFAGLMKEASSSRMTYENRVKEFKKLQADTHEFTKPEPARYAEIEGGIRRAGYGKHFSEEVAYDADHLRSITNSNQKYAENMLNNGFSIWEPEFDELKAAFDQSQAQHDQQFDRRTAAEKQKISHNAWQYQKLNSLREAKVLPYRGLGITRLANEQPIDHDRIGSKNEFYAQAHDEIQEMTRTSNRERKAGITRKGYDPEERRSQWENKETVSARTYAALQNNSDFLMRFAEELSLRDE